MALRRPLEAHLEHFWGLMAKWLSGGPWRLILSISGACWPNGSQEAPGASFGAFPGPDAQMALRRPLEPHLEHFWGLLAKWLSRGPWKLIWSIVTSGGIWGPKGSPMGTQRHPKGSQGYPKGPPKALKWHQNGTLGTPGEPSGTVLQQGALITRFGCHFGVNLGAHLAHFGHIFR
jgi:hypothetical protein